MIAHRVVRLRRAAGMLLLLCLGFLSAETVVADVCDGDGGARQAHVDAVSHAAATHGTSSPDAQEGGTPGAPPVQHSAHIDHCAHPHGGALVASLTQGALDAGRPPMVRAESDRRPPSASSEPQVRPPVI